MEINLCDQPFCTPHPYSSAPFSSFCTPSVFALESSFLHSSSSSTILSHLFCPLILPSSVCSFLRVSSPCSVLLSFIPLNQQFSLSPSFCSFILLSVFSLCPSSSPIPSSSYTLLNRLFFHFCLLSINFLRQLTLYLLLLFFLFNDLLLQLFGPCFTFLFFSVVSSAFMVFSPSFYFVFLSHLQLSRPFLLTYPS